MKKQTIFLCLALILSNCTGLKTNYKPQESIESVDQRLSNFVTPLSYDLTLWAKREVKQD